MSALIPINVIECVEDANLKEISHGARYLATIVKKHGLRKHCDAVLFINSARDRFRIVAMFYKVPVLILPPVDEADRLSLYLSISRWLRRFSPSVRDRLEAEVQHTQARIERQALARQALAKREKRAAHG